MTMSMYSSYTPEDFNNIEEDIFGEYNKLRLRFRQQYINWFWYGTLRRSNIVLVLFLTFFNFFLQLIVSKRFFKTNLS